MADFQNNPPQESPNLNQPAPQVPPSSPQLTAYPNPQPVQQPTTPPPPPANQSPSTSNSGFTIEETKPFTWKAWAKLGYIVIFILFTLTTAFLVSKRIFAYDTGEVKGEILVQTRYQPVLWKDFGEVFEPLVKIPLYYPSDGFVNQEFLLDSGALVSSLPREEAQKMGLSLAKLPRSTFGGFGGTTSFAYKSEAKIKLGEQEIVVPVVFTEAAGTKAILGRSGFFEKYSIYFNSKLERIEIRK